MPHELPPLSDFMDDGTPEAVPASQLAEIGGGTPIASAGVRTGAPTVVHVCDDQGRGFPVDLAQLNATKVAEALVPAAGSANPSNAVFETFHRLAQNQARASAPTSNGRLPVQVTNLSEQTRRTPSPPQERQRAVPIGRPALGPSNPTPVVGSGTGFVDQSSTVPNLVAPPQLASRVPDPSQVVQFEVPGYGPLEIRFHQVIRSGDFLILVIDKRWAGPRGFPRRTTDPIGAWIKGTDLVVELEVIGLEFELGDALLCVTRIQTVGSYAAYTRGAESLSDFMNAAGGPRGEASTGGSGDPARGSGYGFGTGDEAPGF